MSGFAISKMMIYSLLLALMVGVGIRLETQGKTDGCSAYLSGDMRAPSTEYVVSGTRTIEVPCNLWLLRQPVKVQVWCLVDLILAVVFLLNALGDLRDGIEAWQRRRVKG